MFKKAILFTLVLAATVAAKEDKKKEKPKSAAAVLKEAATEISDALKKGDLAGFKAAVSRAEGLRDRYKDKQFQPITKAIGKGVTHKNNNVALAAINSLETMQVAGSGKLLSPLLKVPPQPKEDRLALHIAAIKAAGTIHDANMLKTLEKLLGHPRGDVAAAAASGLLGYRGMEPKPKMALIKRLNGTLAKVEKSTEGDSPAAKRAALLTASLLATIQGLANDKGLGDSKAVAAWLKQASKDAKKN